MHWGSRQPRHNCVVELDQNDNGDAEPRADEAQRSAAGIKRLRDQDPPANAVTDLPGSIGLDQVEAGGICPAPIEHGAGDEDVEPINGERDPVADEFGQQAQWTAASW